MLRYAKRERKRERERERERERGKRIAMKPNRRDG